MLSQTEFDAIRTAPNFAAYKAIVWRRERLQYLAIAALTLIVGIATAAMLTTEQIKYNHSYASTATSHLASAK